MSRQRLVDWSPPDLVQRDRAIFLRILQQDSHTVQAARFGIEIDFAHVGSSNSGTPGLFAWQPASHGGTLPTG